MVIWALCWTELQSLIESIQRKVQWSFRFLFPCEILLQSARNASKNRGSNETESKYFGLENLWSSPGCRKSFVNADYEVSSSAFHCSFRKLNPANGLLVTHCTFLLSQWGKALVLKIQPQSIIVCYAILFSYLFKGVWLRCPSDPIHLITWSL